MPYTLKPNKIYAKDPNSNNYLPQNVITDQSTAEEIAAIEAKGAATLASIPDDYSTLSNEVDDLKSGINHQINLADDYRELASKNIIDDYFLTTASGWTDNNGDFSGPLDTFWGGFNIPVPFAKENTQYTLSLEAYNASQGDTTSTGLVLQFDYTDNTSQTLIYYPNGTSSWTNKYAVSASGKTVKSIGLLKSSGTHNDTWHIKELQVEEGTAQTSFMPYAVSVADSTARNEIKIVNYDISNCVKYATGKNIFDVSATNRQNGLLLSTSGTFSTNATYNTVFLPIKGGTKISCNTPWSYISFYDRYTDITQLLSGDTIQGNLDGSVRGGSASTITVPNNATFYAMSYIATRTNIQVEYGESETSYEPYTTGIRASDVFPLKPIVYDIYADGSGDFANLRACLDGITDASERKPYEVHIHEGTYDVASMFTAQEIAQQSAVGLFVPNYVTLVGVGNRDNIILSAVLSDYNTYFSPLHFRNYGGMKNLTVTATKCRYTVHDDVSVNGIGGHRIVENCKIIGNDLDFGCVYGSGLKEDCHWEFRNTVMDGKTAAKGGGFGLVFLSHNQLGWIKPSSITFENCRFLSLAQEGVEPRWQYAMRFRSLITDGTQTWNNQPVYVHIYGTLCNGIELGEDGNYGSGIAYWVDGYGNKNAWEHVTSTTETPITVDDRFDLIGSF